MIPVRLDNIKPVVKNYPNLKEISINTRVGVFTNEITNLSLKFTQVEERDEKGIVSCYDELDIKIEFYDHFFAGKKPFFLKTIDGKPNPYYCDTIIFELEKDWIRLTNYNVQLEVGLRYNKITFFVDSRTGKLEKL